MASFFEKLKKGMGIEGPIEEMVKEETKPTLDQTTTEPEGPAPKKTRVRKIVKESKVVNKPSSESGPKVATVEEIGEEMNLSDEKIDNKEKTIYFGSINTPEKKSADKKGVGCREKWAHLNPKDEGQLTIDAYQTESYLVIQSAVAGIDPDNLDISIEKDMLTIRGCRERPFEEPGDYFTQECYWGPFSREVILPVEIDPEHIEATMKDGVLSIRIPKILREKKRSISIKNI